MIRLAPEAIHRTLGRDTAASDAGRALLEVAPGRGLLPGLLLLRDVRAADAVAARSALLAAADLAEARGATRILIEAPPASRNGGGYAMQRDLSTPLIELARYCGGEIVVQGADPEGGHVAHADWFQVLDLAGLLAAALPPEADTAGLLDGAVALCTESGAATIAVRDGRATVTPGAAAGVPQIAWPAAAAGQLALGYAAAPILAARGTPVSAGL